jgi:transposase
MVTASDRSAVGFTLSGGECHDAPEGRLLLDRIERLPEQVYLIMDKAYEGESVRNKALERGFSPVVPPKSNRKNPWEYDRKRYKGRNEIERYFLRLKRFRRIYTRYDKLDVVFAGFIYFAMIVDVLICVNTL